MLVSKNFSLVFNPIYPHQNLTGLNVNKWLTEHVLFKNWIHLFVVLLVYKSVDRSTFCSASYKLEAQHWAEPVSLTFHSALRNFFNRPIRNKNCLWWPCLLMDQDKMSNLYKGPSIDASFQVSVHLAEGFQRRRLKCEKLMDDGRQVIAKVHIAFGKGS